MRERGPAGIGWDLMRNVDTPGTDQNKVLVNLEKTPLDKSERDLA
jgi:hypothetical protein